MTGEIKLPVQPFKGFARIKINGTVEDVVEKEVGDTTGLQHHFGFKEYEDARKAGTISDGATIVVPVGTRHYATGQTEVSWYEFIVNNGTLKSNSKTELNPRKMLQGISWYSIEIP